MNLVTRLGGFLYEFVVGDDWVVAVGVVVAIGLTALLAHAGTAAFWLLPPAVVGLLATSLLRAT